MSNRLVRFVASSALLSISVACDGSPTSPGAAEPLPPLSSAVWYAHAAEGQPLPALVAHRLEGGTLVQDFLDSARVEVGASGTWVRRLWMSRYRGGSFDQRVPSQESGTWVATDTAYVFTASTSGRRFSLRAMSPGAEIQLPLRSVTDGYISAAMRTAPPAPAIVGSYRIAEVRGIAVPAPIYVFNGFEDDGRIISVHLIVDSAFIELRHDGTYAHAIFHSEWEGPDGGAPTARRFRWTTFDFGGWAREGTQLRFESDWLQNHRFDGHVATGRVMELRHGISHGDEAVPVRYVQR